MSPNRVREPSSTPQVCRSKEDKKERIYSLIHQRLRQHWRSRVERGGQKSVATNGGDGICMSGVNIPTEEGRLPPVSGFTVSCTAANCTFTNDFPKYCQMQI
ncbi:hypothetical protein RF11_02526 [Thelohanellus kitauei]|uniref:Uncharacterized protein n=1 Tax=Thelohanellus kitauei TaxID=669202 RepID=A0A0C2IDX6_THEKT|nr:hypothetical protein RF11_08053 [Thelohanellus kitauei]KII72120.1 hypothetical protein RF11_02526 [Thelohanellus kitauei]